MQLTLLRAGDYRSIHLGGILKKGSQSVNPSRQSPTVGREVMTVVVEMPTRIGPGRNDVGMVWWWGCFLECGEEVKTKHRGLP